VSQTLSNLSELGMLDVAHGKATRVSQRPFSSNIEIIYAGVTPIDQQKFWSVFYRGIMDELNAAGFSCSTRMLNLHSPDWLRHMEFKNSIGALIVGTGNPAVLDQVKQYGLSFVMVYDRSDDAETSFISCDFSQAMSQIVELFVAQGRKKLAYIGPFGVHDRGGVNMGKYEFFTQYAKQHGVEVYPELPRNTNLCMQEGYDTMKMLLESDGEIDGIFLASDALAPGVYRALHEAGLRIPDDVMIAGCDNLEISKYLVPSLTTIELSRYEIGRKAAKTLIDNINNGDKTVQCSLSPEIIVRESLN
jgi:DNA-binding LacI/PurR family transcriptional regulator